ncbi:hypothetical protein RJ55_02695 [Drechmeria coniospora]|nr:hypothetical protein RJ55_02695 [Drechmeria coniospora]
MAVVGEARTSGPLLRRDAHTSYASTTSPQGEVAPTVELASPLDLGADHPIMQKVWVLASASCVAPVNTAPAPHHPRRPRPGHGDQGGEKPAWRARRTARGAFVSCTRAYLVALSAAVPHVGTVPVARVASASTGSIGVYMDGPRPPPVTVPSRSPAPSPIRSRRNAWLVLARSAEDVDMLSRLHLPGLFLALAVPTALVGQADAFGAGNVASISKVEGKNWRHGDIEDVLLTLDKAQAFGGGAFSPTDVAHVYFGNWLRDYSQAIDVSTLKSVPIDATGLLISIVGFFTFGYGTGDFEVTASRLGVYRPEEHIDNPKNYNNNENARKYDKRLRGRVRDEELAVDPNSGMKNYIANDDPQLKIMTSSKFVRREFQKFIWLGREYKKHRRSRDLTEALRILGGGLHCLEDFFAHSNYVELALLELGQGNVFPHVGTNTRMPVKGTNRDVFPLVTGTFGATDFLHSVLGEVHDSVVQNEVDELEGVLRNFTNTNTGLLRSLFSLIPFGVLQGNPGVTIDHLQNDAKQNIAPVSPSNTELFTTYIRNVIMHVMPGIKFHDDVVMAISQTVHGIPILPRVVQQLQEQISKFVFSVIAPVVVPLIHQVRGGLQGGAHGVIQSSSAEQFVVLDDPRSHDPTHSMIAKDHFSNILNGISGELAAISVKRIVPKLMHAVDDESVDVDALLTRIIHGVLHHPAQRNMGHADVTAARMETYRHVKQWWSGFGRRVKNDYLRRLSINGIRHGWNHIHGVQDSSGRLPMNVLFRKERTFGERIADWAASAIFGGMKMIFLAIINKIKASLPKWLRPS